MRHAERRAPALPRAPAAQRRRTAARRGRDAAAPAPAAMALRQPLDEQPGKEPASRAAPTTERRPAWPSEREQRRTPPATASSAVDPDDGHRQRSGAAPSRAPPRRRRGPRPQSPVSSAVHAPRASDARPASDGEEPLQAASCRSRSHAAQHQPLGEADERPRAPPASVAATTSAAQIVMVWPL